MTFAGARRLVPDLLPTSCSCALGPVAPGAALGDAALSNPHRQHLPSCRSRRTWSISAGSAVFPRSSPRSSRSWRSGRCARALLVGAAPEARARDLQSARFPAPAGVRHDRLAGGGGRVDRRRRRGSARYRCGPLGLAGVRATARRAGSARHAGARDCRGRRRRRWSSRSSRPRFRRARGAHARGSRAARRIAGPRRGQRFAARSPSASAAAAFDVTAVGLRALVVLAAGQVIDAARELGLHRMRHRARAVGNGSVNGMKCALGGGTGTRHGREGKRRGVPGDVARGRRRHARPPRSPSGVRDIRAMRPVPRIA